MTRKCLVLLAIVSVLIFVVAGCAPAAPPAPPVEKPPVEKPPEKIVWRWSGFYPPTASTAEPVKWFYNQIAERSGGRFECQFFWSASLSPAKEEPDNLKAGLFEACSLCSTYYPSKYPLYVTINQPLVFPFNQNSEEEYRLTTIITNEWLETPLLKEEFAKWDALNIAEFLPTQFVSISTYPISTLEDFKGKKIGATGGFMEVMTEVGAVPVPLILAELYEGLDKGIIDAKLNTLGVLTGYRLQEVCKYWTSGINLGGIRNSNICSIKAYEALPDDLKGIFDEVKEEYPAMSASHRIRLKEKSLQLLKEAGVEELKFRAEDNEKLRDIAKGIWKATADKAEEKGVPAREAWNSLQDIIKKHVPGYEPYYLK